MTELQKIRRRVARRRKARLAMTNYLIAREEVIVYAVAFADGNATSAELREVVEAYRDAVVAAERRW